MKANTVRIGLAGYANFLAALRDAPSALSEVPAVAGIGHNCAWRLVNGMYSLGLIRICGYRMRPCQRTLAVFSIGGEPDVVPPSLRPNGRPVSAVWSPSKSCAGPELLAFKHLLVAMESPASRLELAAKTGMHAITVRSALAALVKQKLAHVAMWQWRDCGGPPIPQYLIGPGVNAKRPKPMKKSDIQDRYMQRKEEAARFAPLAQALQFRPLPERTATPGAA